MVEPCSISNIITKQLEYVTKDHIATHTILCKFKMVPFFNLLSGITVLNNIILLIIQSCLYVPKPALLLSIVIHIKPHKPHPPL